MAQHIRIQGMLIILLTLSLGMISRPAFAQEFEIYGPSHQQPKSEEAALRYSLFGTLLPLGTGAIMGAAGEFGGSEIVIMGTGLVVGPSLGYFYGGCPGRGVAGIGTRIGVSAATAVGMCIASKSGNGWVSLGGVVTVGLAGSCFVAIHALVDVGEVKGAVREHSLASTKTPIRVVPTYFADSGAGGLQLQLTF
jgi:hypothetical protein